MFNKMFRKKMFESIMSLMLVIMTAGLVQAMPASPTDVTKVPHYFGPYANYANSPQVLANAVVAITPALADPGLGAEATATVDPKTGAISTVTVTKPGSGYLVAPTVALTSPGMTPTVQATATAAISPGVITSITVVEPGFGFAQPMVTLTGGGFTTPATAVASGGVDSVTLTSPGTVYASLPVVEFSLPNLPTGTRATGSAVLDANNIVIDVIVANPGSGYTTAPLITIGDGGPNVIPVSGSMATAVATIDASRIDVTNGGVGYSSAPTVTVLDAPTPLYPLGWDGWASATATVAVNGAVTGITVTNPGAGYLTPGLKKFVDTLPGLGPTAANDLGNYIPVAVPDTTTYPGSDYYEIGVVQYRMKFHKDLPATLLRGYVQLSTSVVPGSQVPLSNVNLNPAGADAPISLPSGSPALGVDKPHYLGPTIVASKDRPVRILFRNLLPTGVDGNLFLPVDSTIMGSGEGPSMVMLGAGGVPLDKPDAGTVMDEVRYPPCGEVAKMADCFKDNRATLHLHGGVTPWISDGTPHQWTTPAGENTTYPAGVSVKNVPDMPDPGPGAITFFYTNQQSARLMFYHDHAWGITRLNVYAGEAAGYVITDAMEQSLIATGGALSGLGIGTPLVIQDKTFVPANIAATDPTWDASRWGGVGSLWAPHVYMTAQNPGDPSGMSAFGRWMYGPWFWPPAGNATFQPIANPYFDPNCDPNVMAFCEPALIPSTPNISVGMEAFNDTPLVNGTAYPTTTVDPKAYRFRILNAANDRFWNLSLYVADPRTGTLSEVALNPAEVAAAQTDPVVTPNPDTAFSPKGPNWVQIGTEGGFLPAPVVIPAQPTTFITDPTRFDVGNVDQHSLLLAPAERADVIVDFSQFRGKTLILYNDAPAAFPARVPGYDYYTGGPDLSPVGAPTTLPGYGPNTRTIMQIKVSNAAPAVAFDRPNTTIDGMGKLQAAFAHHLDAAGNPAGVFEAGQDPIIVGQSDYNSAYGTSFVTNGWCNGPTNPSVKCDGFARIQEQGGFLFNFDTLLGAKLNIPLQPKGMHDEMNSANFDPWGRMTANIGLEAPGATPLLQNIILYPYVNPVTEILDSTSLPSSLHVTPISSGTDGTQIWKITHNGVDTHPIHFHLYDVQVLNRVTWDNIIIPPEPSELGWKDTVRISPLEDTIVAVRPIVPTLPFALPDSIRPLNPGMPLGAAGSQNGPNGTEAGFNNTDTNGNPIAPIVNELFNFNWEYVWHCHILSHEEMDMMRPVSVIVANDLPDAPVLTSPGGNTLNWTDGTPVNYLVPSTWGSPKNEIGFRVERALVDINNVAGPYSVLTTALANTTNFTDTAAIAAKVYDYRVIAFNVAGDSTSNILQIITPSPIAAVTPTTLTFSPQLISTTSTAQTVTLTNTGNAALIFSLAMSGAQAGDFAQSNSCAGTVAIGGNCVVSVTYTPAAVGASAASLDITSNDPANPLLSISLSGTGKAPAPIASVTPTTLTFLSQVIHTTSVAQTVTLSNTGNAALTFSLVTSGAQTGDFAQSNSCAGTVAIGGNCVISVTYTPAAVGASAASLDITSNDPANALLSISLNGTGAPAPAPILAVTPAMLSFLGQVIHTTSVAQTVTLTNTGNAALTFNLATSGTQAGDFAQSNSCAGTIAIGGNCVISVTYTPAAVGASAAILDITSNDPLNPLLSISLSGTGVPAPAPILAVTPTTLTFLNQVVNTTSAAQTVTLTNTGNAALTFSLATSGTQAGDFAQTNSCAGSVAIGGNCLVSVTYRPVAAGASAASLNITSNDPAKPLVAISLSGTGTAAPVLLVAPTNLTATIQSATRISLRWTDASNNETSFAIWRSDNGGTFAQVGTVNRNATNSVATGGTVTFNNNGTATSPFVAGTTYSYYVTAVNALGSSTPSNTAVVAFSVPAAPTNLTASIASATRISLSWIDASNNETSFAIWRSDNGGAFSQVGTVTRSAANSVATGGTVTFNNNSTVASPFVVGTTYSYYVVAVNAPGASAASNTTVVAFSAPAAPSNVAVACVRVGTTNNAQCTLTWSDNSTNETGFRIQRANNAGFAPVAQTVTRTANTVTWTTGNIARNTAWYFHIQSYNSVGGSVYVNATPFPVPAPIN